MKAVAGALASAALFGLAAKMESPWHWAAFVALAPWLLALRGASGRAAIGSAVLFAMAYAAAVYPWFPAAIEAYSGARPIVAWCATLLLAPILIEPQIVVAAACRVFAPQRLRAAVFVAAWIGAEWALPKVFPDTLGYALFPSERMRQAAEIAGVRGLTLACLVVAEWLVERRVLAAAALVLALQGYGALRLHQVESRTRAAPLFFAGVVQANITRYDKLAAEQGSFETVRQILDAHAALSRDLLAQGPLDLLVWPETVYPTTFGAPKSDDGAEFDRAIQSIPSRSGVPLVFGAFLAGEGGDRNAAFFLQPGGRWEAYAKSRLFPLTEEVPRWLDTPRVRSAAPWLGHWQPGPGPRSLALGGLRFAPLICYEAILPGYVAAAARSGADALLTLSNDSWFPDARAPRLHLVGAAFRSIETRLPQIRATNSGISALILPAGEIASSAAFGTRAALRLPVPRVGRPWTPVLALGDWLGPLALAVAAACCTAAAWTGRARATEAEEK